MASDRRAYEFMERKGAIAALIGLRQRAMSSEELGELAGVTPETAKRLREEMEKMGLITVTATKRRGAIRHEIVATARGKAAARHAAALATTLTARD